MNSGFTSHRQLGHTETGSRFKVSSERPEKRGIKFAIPGLIVLRVIYYTTTAPDFDGEMRTKSTDKIDTDKCKQIL